MTACTKSEQASQTGGPAMNIIRGDYEWDDAKARSNQRKWGVSFIEAITLFNDPVAFTQYSAEHSSKEERYVSVGLSQRGRLLAIAWTERSNRVRIISARPVLPRERRSYEETSPEF
jgi:uncharacterized protein